MIHIWCQVQYLARKVYLLICCGLMEALPWPCRLGKGTPETWICTPGGRTGWARVYVEIAVSTSVSLTKAGMVAHYGNAGHGASLISIRRRDTGGNCSIPSRRNPLTSLRRKIQQLSKPQRMLLSRGGEPTVSIADVGEYARGRYQDEDKAKRDHVQGAVEAHRP